jgi:hypothetical protein
MSLTQVLVVGSGAARRNALVDILEECGPELVIAWNVEETIPYTSAEELLQGGTSVV